jgi:hypothetical protein
MPAKPKRAKQRAKAKTAQERMSARRQRLREQGLRPVQHWVPDLRDPRVRAQVRREAALLSKPHEIDQWIEAAVDWSEWK